MTDERFATISTQAESLRLRFTQPRVTYYHARKGGTLTHKGRKSRKVSAHSRPPITACRHNELPLVTLAEADFLATNYPTVCAFVRTVRYHPKQWFRPASQVETASQPVTMREIWVGSRPWSVIGERDPSDLDAESLDYFDAQEMSDLVQFTHDTPAGPMIEDGTAMRPLKVGDVVQVVRSANDDLSELFGTEDDDPNQPGQHNDFAHAEPLTNAFHANRELVMHSSNLPDGMKYDPNNQSRHLPEKQIRARAQQIACEMFEDVTAAIVDRVEDQLTDLLELNPELEKPFSESGYWVSKAEYLAELDQLKNQPAPLAKKQGPAPMDWGLLRKSRDIELHLRK